jgi:hypothetical protein
MNKEGRKLVNFQSDIWLYAKGWYVRGNVLSDMRRIFAYTFELEEEDVTAEHIIEYLAEMAWEPVISKEKDCMRRFVNCALETSGTPEHKLICGFLSILKYVTTRIFENGAYKDVIHLDPPDASVLPLAHPNHIWHDCALGLDKPDTECYTV